MGMRNRLSTVMCMSSIRRAFPAHDTWYRPADAETGTVANLGQVLDAMACSMR